MGLLDKKIDECLRLWGKMQKVLISMDDMPFLMTVIVGVKHISLTGLHHAVETCDNPSFYYYLQKDWDWSWVRLCALNPRFSSARNSIRACAVSYLPEYVCVHETFIKADIFISLFLKDSTFLFVFRFQWKVVFQLTLEGHMQTLNFK